MPAREPGAAGYGSLNGGADACSRQLASTASTEALATNVLMIDARHPGGRRQFACA
jgi:hypothetical protein